MIYYGMQMLKTTMLTNPCFKSFYERRIFDKNDSKTSQLLFDNLPSLVIAEIESAF